MRYSGMEWQQRVLEGFGQALRLLHTHTTRQPAARMQSEHQGRAKAKPAWNLSCLACLHQRWDPPSGPPPAEGIP